MMANASSKKEEAMNTIIKSPEFHRPPPVTAVKRMSRAASIYEDCAFPAQGRQPELGGRKNDEGRNTQVGAPGKQGLLFKGFPDHDHRVALTVDFS